MKTSKVKAIHETKTWNGQNGTVFYQNLEMENGDKINIGRKKEMQIGWELTYEFIDDLGQHEFTKAKAVKPEQPTFKKDDSYTKGIEVGHAVNNAVNLICAGVELPSVHGYKNQEEKIYMYANFVLALSNRLKSEQ